MLRLHAVGAAHVGGIHEAVVVDIEGPADHLGAAPILGGRLPERAIERIGARSARRVVRERGLGHGVARARLEVSVDQYLKRVDVGDRRLGRPGEVQVCVISGTAQIFAHHVDRGARRLRCLEHVRRRGLAALGRFHDHEQDQHHRCQDGEGDHQLDEREPAGLGTPRQGSPARRRRTGGSFNASRKSWRQRTARRRGSSS